eukprot:SAG31_NODE_5638_length_2410_cov_2.118131_4_plen_84_part_00
MEIVEEAGIPNCNRGRRKLYEKLWGEVGVPNLRGRGGQRTMFGAVYASPFSHSEICGSSPPKLPCAVPPRMKSEDTGSIRNHR